MNKCFVIGRVCQDIKTMTVGAKETLLAKFSVAVWKSKDKTNFFNCVAFNKSAEYIASKAHKGSRVAIEGELDQNSWTDKNGSKHTSVGIIVNRIDFLDKVEKSQPEDSGQPEETPF